MPEVNDGKASAHLDEFMGILYSTPESLVDASSSSSCSWCPKDVVSAVTTEIAFDKLLPAALSRGDFTHLAVLPEEAHPDLDMTLHEDYIGQWNNYYTHHRGNGFLPRSPYHIKLNFARRRDWARDKIKGKAVSLLREWLHGKQDYFSLQYLAADQIALDLFWQVVHDHPNANSNSPPTKHIPSKPKSIADIHMLLATQLNITGGSMENVRDAVTESLAAMWISWELSQDLLDAPNDPRNLQLPGCLQGFEELILCVRTYNLNDFYCRVRLLLPFQAGRRGSLAAIATRVVLVHRMARQQEERYYLEDGRGLVLFDLLIPFFNKGYGKLIGNGGYYKDHGKNDGDCHNDSQNDDEGDDGEEPHVTLGLHMAIAALDLIIRRWRKDFNESILQGNERFNVLVDSVQEMSSRPFLSSCPKAIKDSNNNLEQCLPVAKTESRKTSVLFCPCMTRVHRVDFSCRCGKCEGDVRFLNSTSPHGKILDEKVPSGSRLGCLHHPKARSPGSSSFAEGRDKKLA